MSTNLDKLKQIIEGALLAAGRPLSIDQILMLFIDEDQPSRQEIREAIDSLKQDCENRGVELAEVSSGFRFQVRPDLAKWVSRLWEEKPARYSRAVMETLALIAYRQPITRGEIEDVRGVSVSSHIVKGLLEREWVRIVGHRDVPGKPALFGTTKTFLDYFNLKSLSDLPPLAEIKNIESIEGELDFSAEDKQGAVNEAANDVTEQEVQTPGEDGLIAVAATELASNDSAETESKAAELLAEAIESIEEEVASEITEDQLTETTDSTEAKVETETDAVATS
jgi:segregation and condensation protein B